MKTYFDAVQAAERKVDEGLDQDLQSTRRQLRLYMLLASINDDAGVFFHHKNYQRSEEVLGEALALLQSQCFKCDSLAPAVAPISAILTLNLATIFIATNRVEAATKLYQEAIARILWLGTNPQLKQSECISFALKGMGAGWISAS